MMVEVVTELDTVVTLRRLKRRYRCRPLSHTSIAVRCFVDFVAFVLRDEQAR
jgi:hypothetical protein